MKSASFFTMVLVAAASLSLMAQQSNGDMDANSSAKATYATQGPMGFGDEAASHAYEMSSVTGELQGKLDAKTAKVGDRVVLKTTDKVQTSDGTVIPRGTRLVGHITQVQARDSAHGVSEMAIAFDRAELKNGQSIAIHTLIRGASISSSATAMNPMNPMNPMNNDDSMSTMSAPMNGGTSTGGGRSPRSGGERLGGIGGVAGGTVERTTTTTSSVADRAGADENANTEGTVKLAGHGDVNGNIGAHQQAAARAVPRPTAIPGVMLAGDSSASGMFSASKKDIQFDSGTQMQLGIVRDSDQ